MEDRNAAVVQPNAGDTTSGSAAVAADVPPFRRPPAGTRPGEAYTVTIDHDYRKRWAREVRRTTRMLRTLESGGGRHPARVLHAVRARRIRSRATRRASARLAPARPGGDDPSPDPPAELAARVRARCFETQQRRALAYVIALALIEVAMLATGLAH